MWNNIVHKLAVLTIQGSILITGTKALIEDVSSAIIVLDIPVTAIMCMYFWFKKTHSEDEQDDKKWNSRFKTSLFAGIVVLCIASLINVIASYYGGTPAPSGGTTSTII